MLVAVVALLAAACSSGDDDGLSNPDPESLLTIPSTVADEQPIVETVVPEEPPELVWAPLYEPGVGGRVTDIAIDPNDPEHLVASGDMLGIAVSFDGGVSWETASGLASGEASTITFDPTDPSRLWVGTMSGPFTSTDGGLTWEERRGGMPPFEELYYIAPIEAVLVDPADGNHLFAFGGSHREWENQADPLWGAVWESTDAGGTWTQVGQVAGGENIVSAAFAAGDPSVMLASVLDRGVWRSDDRGRTWTEASSGLPHDNVRQLAAHPADPNRFWVALGEGPEADPRLAGGVWTTTDGGATWQDSSTGLTSQRDADANLTAQFHALEVAPSDPDVLYTSDVAWGMNAVFRSGDGGATWDRVLNDDNAPEVPYWTAANAESIAIDPTDADRVTTANAEFILLSDDGGGTWVDRSSAPARGGWVGRGWSGLVATRVAFDPTNGDDAYLLGFDGANLIRSTDDLETWDRPLVDPIGDAWNGSYDISFGGSTGDTIAVVLGQAGLFNGIAYTHDGGATWSHAVGAASGLPERYEWFEGDFAVQAIDRDGRRMLAAIGGQLHVSADGGASWSTGALDGVRDLATTPGRIEEVWATADDGTYHSSDGGTTWEPVAGGVTEGERITVTDDVVYVTRWRRDDGDNGVFRYDMATGAWDRILDDDFAFQVAVDPTDPEHLLVAANDHPFHDEILSAGVYRSTDCGETWDLLTEGLTMLRVAAIAFDPDDPGRVVAGTFGQGFWVIEGVTPDAVADGDTAAG
ncbi:MAG: hypothetical protein S0880_00560 [Actinomycetota bacterium]|nr:hypothetical protein [Actinomycetota bacterium]